MDYKDIKTICSILIVIVMKTSSSKLVNVEIKDSLTTKDRMIWFAVMAAVLLLLIY